MAETSVSMSKARTLCTKAELELVLWSTRTRLATITPLRIGGKITRARALRDKYRDLASEQRRQRRGKSARRPAPAVGDNENTRLKAQLFAEVLERFQGAADRLGVAATRAKAAKGSKARKAAKGAKPAKPVKAAKSAPTATAKKSTRRGKASAARSAARPASSNSATSNPGGSGGTSASSRRARPASTLLAGAGSFGTLSLAPASPAAVEARRAVRYAKGAKGQSERVRMAVGPSHRTVRGVAGLTRRAQAKRDSR